MEDGCRNLDLQIICEENLNTSNTYINSCKMLQKIQNKNPETYWWIVVPEQCNCHTNTTCSQ